MTSLLTYYTRLLELIKRQGTDGQVKPHVSCLAFCATCAMPQKYEICFTTSNVNQTHNRHLNALVK